MNYYLLPVSICQFSIQEQWYRQLQVWLIFKHFSSGKVKIDKSLKREMAQYLNISCQTVRRSLCRLDKRNWIGTSPAGWTFIRGFRKVQQIEELKGNSAALFKMNWIQKIRQFVAAVAIGYLVNHQKRTETRGLGSKRRDPNHGSRPGPHREVSLRALAQILEVSESTAYRLRKEAEKAGFISMKQHFKRTQIEPQYLDQYKENCDESEARRLVIRNDEVFVQLPNLVKPEIKFKSRR